MVFQPGHKRVGGKQKGYRHAVVKSKEVFSKQASAAAKQTILKIAKYGENDAVKLKAAELITAYSDGRPVQKIEGSFKVEEIQQTLAQVIAVIKKHVINPDVRRKIAEDLMNLGVK